MDERTANDIRRSERMACVGELLAIARTAEREPPEITYVGGIETRDAARILRAAAREIDLRGDPDTLSVPLAREREARG